MIVTALAMRRSFTGFAGKLPSSIVFGTVSAQWWAVTNGITELTNYFYSNFYRNTLLFQNSNFCDNFITFFKVLKLLITIITL